MIWKELRMRLRDLVFELKHRPYCYFAVQLYWVGKTPRIRLFGQFGWMQSETVCKIGKC